MLQEFLTCIRYFQQAVVFDFFGQITGNQCLADNSIPSFVFFSHTGTEHFQIFMQMRLHFRSFFSLYNIYNIVCFKIFFYRKNSFYYGAQ